MQTAHPRHSRQLILAVLLVLAALVSACDPTPTPIVSESELAIELPLCLADLGRGEALSLSDGRAYVPDQILFTGVSADIEALIVLLNEALEQGRIADSPHWTMDGLLAGSATESGYDIRLYSITGDGPNAAPDAIEVVQTAIDILESQVPGTLSVVPEINIVARSPDDDVVANPGGTSSGIEGNPGGTSSGIEGNPGGTSSGIEGNPGGTSSGIEGNPGDEPGTVGSAADLEAIFLSQWVFQGGPEQGGGAGRGINLIQAEDAAYRTTARGAGVRVAVFDSSPLTAGYHQTGVHSAGSEFQLCVSSRLDEETALDIAHDAVAQHGYFAASLVQAVAPESNIHLVQSLDKNLRSSLGLLLNDIWLYLKAYEASLPDQRHVLNLSLGFELTYLSDLDGLTDLGVDPALIAMAQENELRLQQLLNQYQQLPTPVFSELPQPNGLGTPSPPLSFVALQVLLHHVQEQGHLVVASAGNEWRGVPPQPVALAPAVFSPSLGVGSTNYDGDPSCFSNAAEAGAPSGDGISECQVILIEQCADALTGLPNRSGCQDAVIGRVVANASTGYEYWIGTSFSSPLASGLAALVWGERPDMTPLEVRQLILSCQTKNVIDVERTVLAAQSGLMSCP
jgi:hypothetical protein